MKRYYAVNLLKNKQQVVFVAAKAEDKIGDLEEHAKMIKKYFKNYTVLHVEEIFENQFESVLKSGFECYELSLKLQS